MKTLNIISVVLTVRLAVATASPDSLESKHRRQIKGAGGRGSSGGMGGMGGFTGMLGLGGYGKVTAGSLPKRTQLTPRYPNVPGSKTIKLRYGPYKVPDEGKKTITGEGGMLWNYPDFILDKPCENCMLIGLNSGLEYLDGKNANVDTGLWLHHIVLLNSGTGRSDPTCKNSLVSLPHMVVGMMPQTSERFWASGNERTSAHFPAWGVTDAGYPVRKGDRFAMIVDLMNMNPEAKTVYVTMYYDYVEGFPAGWDEVKPIWFDISQCLFSEWPPTRQTGAFTVTANPWTADFGGEILGVAGHLHDGGTNVLMEVDGKLACDSVAKYGESSEFISPTASSSSTGHSHAGMPHLSSMSFCTRGKPDLKVAEVKKGQKWVLKAPYDYDKHKGMTHGNGAQDNIMGISIMFVRVKK